MVRPRLSRPGLSRCAEGVRAVGIGEVVMRFLATLHRWWGVAFCLLFAMWFASGIVMHFAPFPARSASGASLSVDRSGTTTDRIDYDQWTVAGDYNADRPLDRSALNDAAGTEISVSSNSGKI